MYQLIGAIMVISACLLFSVQKVGFLKRKLCNLKQMQKAFFLMKHEISFSARELWEASFALSEAVSGDVGALFAKIGNLLSEEETLSFFEAWERALSGQAALFSQEVQTFLKDFARQIGTLSRDLEEEHLNKAAQMLEQLQKEEEAEYQKNRKLIYALGGLIGAAILILFI